MPDRPSAPGPGCTAEPAVGWSTGDRDARRTWASGQGRSATGRSPCFDPRHRPRDFGAGVAPAASREWNALDSLHDPERVAPESRPNTAADRKSTRLNSSHVKISYAVFCLKKKRI